MPSFQIELTFTARSDIDSFTFAVEGPASSLQTNV